MSERFQLGKGWVGMSRTKYTRAEWATARDRAGETVPTMDLATGEAFPDDAPVVLIIGNGTPLGTNFELPLATVERLGFKPAVLAAGRRLQALARAVRAAYDASTIFVHHRKANLTNWKWWRAVDIDFDLDTAGPVITGPGNI